MRRAFVNKEQNIQNSWCSKCGKIWRWSVSPTVGEKLEVVIDFKCKRCKEINKLLFLGDKVYVVSKKLLNKQSLMNSLSSGTRDDILENINK